MTRTKIVVVSAVSLLSLCGSPEVLADLPVEPTSYIAPSRNQEFEFVMNAPRGRGRDKRGSGLYRRGTIRPLWTVDWYAGSVIVSSDGVHLVRRGPWPSWVQDEAFSFFANGKLLHGYRIKELVSSTEGVWFVTTSHIAWLEREHFDDAKGLLAITTLSGDEHVFSVATGQLIHSGTTAERMLKAEICEFRVASRTDSAMCRSLFPEVRVLSIAPCSDYIRQRARLHAVCGR